MSTTEILFLLAGIVYVLFLVWCLVGWQSMQEIAATSASGNRRMTVIVPARNEEKNIGRCLDALAAQEYPAYEVIVVDDDSQDDTTVQVEQYFARYPHLNGRLIRMGSRLPESGPYKKRAIAAAVDVAQGEWIVTTDADCMVPPGWLSAIDSFCGSREAVFVSAPVVLSEEKTLLEKMQSLEFMGLVGIGAGALARDVPVLCNGANMAYSRAAFRECGGYAEDVHASGDDTTLLLKMHRLFPGRVFFLKSGAATVSTPALSSLGSLMQQRIRWSSKIPFQMSAFTVVIAACAFLFHAGLVAGLLFSPAREIYLFAGLGKAAVEFLFLYQLTGFFRKRRLLRYFIPAQLVYPVYVVVTGLLALRGRYFWKGRKQMAV